MVVVLEVGLIRHEPPREEGRHGKFGVYEQVDPLVACLMQQRHQAVDHLALRFLPGDGAHLGRADGDSS